MKHHIHWSVIEGNSHSEKGGFRGQLGSILHRPLSSFLQTEFVMTVGAAGKKEPYQYVTLTSGPVLGVQSKRAQV